MSPEDLARAQTYTAAINAGRAIVREERDFLSPSIRLGTLSEFEWRKLAEQMVSGWIIERSKQMHAERITDEETFMKEGTAPEPFELGRIAAILPALARLVEHWGLSEQPIGEWERDQILRFLWRAIEFVEQAKVAEKERPTDPSIKNVLYAG
jgi:hypothetical protein